MPSGGQGGIVCSVVKSRDIFCLVSVGNFTAGRSYRLFTTLRDSVSKALYSSERLNDFVKSLLTPKRGANETPREVDARTGTLSPPCGTGGHSSIKRPSFSLQTRLWQGSTGSWCHGREKKGGKGGKGGETIASSQGYDVL